MKVAPCIKVDDNHFRHDIVSDDVKRVHPDLPDTPEKRLAHQHKCDVEAYDTIKKDFPLFLPPSTNDCVRT